MFRDCLTALFLIPDVWILKQRILTLMSINKQSKQISRINRTYQWKLWQEQVCKLDLVSGNQISGQLCRYLGVENPPATTHTVEHMGSIHTKRSWKIHWLFKYTLKKRKKHFQYTSYLSQNCFSKSTKNNVDLPEISSEIYEPQRGQYLRYAAPSSGNK